MYEETAYVLQEFHILHSVHYNAISVILTNQCAQLSLVSE